MSAKGIPQAQDVTEDGSWVSVYWIGTPEARAIAEPGWQPISNAVFSDAEVQQHPS